MEFKRVATPMDFKFVDEAAGTFRAVFATLNVVDHDGDVTLPGAFRQGQPVRISQWGHNWGALPVGKGIIAADDHQAWVDGQFFLDTAHGMDTYKTVRGLGSLQQWSYGFQIDNADFGEFDGDPVRFLRALDTYEVSPVMLGAGIATHTESIKGVDGTKGALPYHANETAPEDATWDGPAEVAKADGRMQLRRMHAWVDPDGDPDAKSSYKLPHHRADGTVVWRGVAAAMAALMGSRGGMKIPTNDRQPVFSHLAKHYAQYDKTPPDFEKGLTLDDEAETALATVAGLTERVRSLSELRQKEGRAISSARRDQMAGIAGQLKEAAAALDAILAETAPVQANGLALFAEFQKISARVNGVAV